MRVEAPPVTSGMFTHNSETMLDLVLQGLGDAHLHMSRRVRMFIHLLAEHIGPALARMA